MGGPRTVHLIVDCRTSRVCMVQRPVTGFVDTASREFVLAGHGLCRDELCRLLFVVLSGSL